jgi:hypothetical protein
LPVHPLPETYPDAIPLPDFGRWFLIASGRSVLRC